MLMTWIWSGLIFLALAAAMYTGRGAELSAAVVTGAQSGVTLSIGMAGAICLWSGLGNVMEKTGVMAWLAKTLRPLLQWLFPSSAKDPALAGNLSANFCANLLGLGNAATPMGIRAAKGLAKGGEANDELCRLIVLNTASIQLIPANVAAVRASLGCGTPFDILPAVWLTSLCSAGLGLTAAWLFGKVWPHD